MGRYIRLVDFNSQQEKENAFLVAAADSNCGYAFDCKTEDFDKIPGSPIAYWVSNLIISVFNNSKLLNDVASPKQGIATADNNKYLRIWHECNIVQLCFNRNPGESQSAYLEKWFPYNKGGEYRKWYGNNDYVINWESNGQALKADKKAVLRNPTFYFQECISWSLISSSSISFRYKPIGNLFDVAGMSCFFAGKVHLWYILALNNSCLIDVFMAVLAPTINYQVGNIANIPVKIDEQKKPQIDNFAQENIAISKADWDSFETSWDFALSPFIEYKNKTTYKSNNATSFKIEDAYFWYKLRTETDFVKLKANEEELNRLFIEIYGLQDELTPDVADKDVTVARIYDTKEEIPASMKGNKYVLTRQDVIKDLISYLVGVAFGRYSLDTEGIVFAGGEFDFSQYATFKPDADGVIPIYSQVGMDNGLTAAIIKLIQVIYGEESYRENIDFVAESLIKRSNESSEETLNRYLCDEFYADHLKKYKKRPIYWQFCSGKNSGFKCLIYMHIYNSDTLAVVNSKYFLPESTRLKNEYDEFTVRIIEADNKDKVRLEKEKSKIFAAYAEALEYGQVLDHMANRYISIDLDDGVVINYAKFQSVELVSDSGNKIKKDLLSPIK